MRSSLSGWRPAVSSAPLFDSELFTRHFEDACERAYQRYFEGKAPKIRSSSRHDPAIAAPPHAYIDPASRPDGRGCYARKGAVEESPGSTRDTAAGNARPRRAILRDSATENRPPAWRRELRQVRVKRWGKSPPRATVTEAGKASPAGSKTE